MWAVNQPLNSLICKYQAHHWLWAHDRNQRSRNKEGLFIISINKFYCHYNGKLLHYYIFQEYDRLKLLLDNEDIIEKFIGEELREFYSECQQMEKMIKVQKKSKIEKVVTAFLFQRWKENSEINWHEGVTLNH